MTSSDSKVSNVQKHFHALSEIASSLNSASNELTRAVACLDEALKKLNIGLTVWVTFRSRGVDEAQYDDDQIGYGKVEGRWGLTIRHIWGDYSAERFDCEGPWLFNDAPREMRLAGVDKIPEVVEELAKEAFNTTKKVEEKARQVQGLSAAIAEITSEPHALQTKKAVLVTADGSISKQLERIRAELQNHQRFLWSMLEHASRWELRGNELGICFPAQSRALAEMLQARDPISKLAETAKHVLGYPVQVVVNLETATVTSSAARNRGNK